MRFFLALVLVLTTSCAGTASYIRQESRHCRPADSFNAYAKCVDGLLAVSGQPEAIDIRRKLPILDDLVSRAQVEANEAAEWVDEQIIAWHTRESDSFYSGLAVMAKVAVGAAIIVGTVALVNASSRGQSKNQSAQGCCSWHGGIDRCGYSGNYLCEDGWESGCMCR